MGQRGLKVAGVPDHATVRVGVGHHDVLVGAAGPEAAAVVERVGSPHLVPHHAQSVAIIVVHEVVARVAVPPVVGVEARAKRDTLQISAAGVEELAIVGGVARGASKLAT